MGIYIRTVTEKFRGGAWEFNTEKVFHKNDLSFERETKPNTECSWSEDAFDYQSYGMFAFLAGVRNDFGLMPIAEGRGFPDPPIIKTKAEPQKNGFWFWA